MLRMRTVTVMRMNVSVSVPITMDMAIALIDLGHDVSEQHMVRSAHHHATGHCTQGGRSSQ